MEAKQGPVASTLPSAPQPAAILEGLENHEVVYFPVCPFPLPEGDDRRFLLQQKLGRGTHKNISFDPHTSKVGGCRYRSPADAARVLGLFEFFSVGVTRWLAEVLPQYARAWQPDRVSFRPEEEATRSLRQTARNDLLHVDAFPTRPTNGNRILRCFANVNPAEPRIWVTSEPFPRLLEQFGREVGLPSRTSVGLRVRDGLVRLFFPRRPRRSPYDAFMLRFHDFLKCNDRFQEGCPKRYWSFPPGSAWLVFTDSVAHAALRGRYALEHSYFVPTHCLKHPESAPAAYLRRACGQQVLLDAA